ncbi:MAG TPA: glycosyltransferase [Candidatus Mediterraneibacter cottocaccae]|nr:glycosyltransferase [Candidatus Mediterraneibacter cottocaccae]
MKTRSQMIQETKDRVPVHEWINFENSSKNVKVSIVVPICNVEMFLSECLDSLINQTLKDIEIICVNDGSKDNCINILYDYAQKDDRIKIINKENAGYGHTMNIGMDMACGKYIGIVESDDFVRLNMFEDLYHIAEENNLDFVKADFYRFTRENNSLHLFYNILSRNPELYNRVLSADDDIDLFKFTNTWSGIYKRSFLEENNIRHQETPGASYQDNGFWFQTTCSAKRFYYVDKPYYMNRRDNPNSSVYDKRKIYAGNSEYQYIYRYLQAHPDLKEKFIGIYSLKKFDNYFYNYRRVSEEYKKEFLFKFSEEFKEAFERNEVEKSLFSKSNYEKLCEIVENPEAFYEKTHELSDISYKAELSDDKIVPMVLISDDNYVIQTATAVASIIKNKKRETQYDITIIAVEMSDENIKKFTFMKRDKIDINIIYVTKEKVQDLHPSAITNFGVSSTALIKFELPNLMAHCNKIIYLDGDLVVKRDLSELFNYNLDDNYAGVVRDIPQVLYEKQAFGEKYGRDYFNSGVMLLNLELMRKNNLTEIFIETKKNIDSKLMDQDVFNEIFATRMIQLPIKYNTLFVNLVRSKNKYKISQINEKYKTKYRSLNDIRRDSAVIHFCSKDKPWKYYDVPAADLWIEYFKRTPYSNTPLQRISISEKSAVVEGNGLFRKTILEENLKYYPIVLWGSNANRAGNINIIKQLKSDRKNDYRYGVYILHNNIDNETIKLYTEMSDEKADVFCVNISKLYERDREYFTDKKLHPKYYKILVPEILSQFEKVLILENVNINNDIRECFEINMKNRIVGMTGLMNDNIRFWDSGAILIHVDSFITNITKMKFVDAYNEKKLANKSYNNAIKMAIGSNKMFMIAPLGIDVENYNIKCALNDLKDMVGKTPAKKVIDIDEKRDLIRKIKDLETQRDYLQFSLDETRKSFSYRLGLKITSFPRWIRAKVRSNREV